MINQLIKKSGRPKLKLEGNYFKYLSHIPILPGRIYETDSELVYKPGKMPEPLEGIRAKGQSRFEVNLYFVKGRKLCGYLSFSKETKTKKRKKCPFSIDGPIPGRIVVFTSGKRRGGEDNPFNFCGLRLSRSGKEGAACRP